MNLLVGLIALVASILIAFPVQEIIPPIVAWHGARIIFVPMLFAYGALSLPFPLMLVAAVLTGLLTDLANLHVVGPLVEIGLGWSIVYYVLLGCLAHGFQPAFKAGHWWLYLPLSFIATSTLLFLQFLMITIRRDGFAIGEITAWRILAPGVLAMLISPFIVLVVRLAEPWLIGFPALNSARRYSRK